MATTRRYHFGDRGTVSIAEISGLDDFLSLRAPERMRVCLLLHVATALVVSFLGKRAVELAVFDLTTAFVHRLACFAASHFLLRAKRRYCEHCKDQPRSHYRGLHVVTSFHLSNSKSKIFIPLFKPRRDQSRWN